MTGRSSNPALLPDQQAEKVLPAPKSLNKLCGVWILFRFFRYAEFEAVVGQFQRSSSRIVLNIKMYVRLYIPTFQISRIASCTFRWRPSASCFPAASNTQLRALAFKFRLPPLYPKLLARAGRYSVPPHATRGFRVSSLGLLNRFRV